MNADSLDASDTSLKRSTYSENKQNIKQTLKWLKNYGVALSFILFLTISGILWISNDYRSDVYEQKTYGYDSSQRESINDHPANFSSGLQYEEFYTGSTPGTYDAARQMGIKDADWIENNTDGYRGLIHIIVNPHWDVDYMRSYSVNMQDGTRNMAEIMEFCRLYPDFTATFDAVLFVKAFWENYPQYRNELLKYIQQGRIEIAQGSVSEFDVCGHDTESLIRDIIYGQNWVKQTLGVQSSVAWLTDLLDPRNFAVGKVLKDAGFDYYYCCRDQISYNEEAYYWEMDNGEEILCFHTGTYNNFPFQMEDFMLDFSTRLDSLEDRNIANKENILYTLGLDMLSPLPWIDNFVDLWNNGMSNLTGYRMVWSTPTRFFTALEHTPSIEDVRTLSVDTADIKSRCSGTVASNANYKVLDRAYEEILNKIETYGVFGALGTSTSSMENRYNYNQDLLTSGWWVKSIGHAHDTAVGVVVKKGNDAVTGRYLQGLSPLRNGLNEAKEAFVGLKNGKCVLPNAVLSALGGQSTAQALIDDGRLKAIAVANKNAWNTTQPVQFGWNWTANAQKLIVYDYQGNALPSQKVPYYNASQFDVYTDVGKGIMNGNLGYKPVYAPDNPIIREWQLHDQFMNENLGNMENIPDQFKPDWQQYDDYFMFLADVPSVGYSYYYILENETTPDLSAGWDTPDGYLAPSNTWIANKFYNITFNEFGSVTSIMKDSQAAGYKEFVDPSNPIFEVNIQETHTSSDSKGAAYSLNIDGKPVINSTQNANVPTEMWLEKGPIYAALHVSQTIYNSEYNRTFRLFSNTELVNYGLMVDIDPLDLEIEDLDWHTLTTDLSFKSLNREGYFSHRTDAKLRPARNGGDSMKYLHNWAYFESENSGTPADNAEQSMFVAMRGPTGVHLRHNTNTLHVNHDYRRYLIRSEDPNDDRVTINNQTGIISNQVNVFFGNGSYHVNRSQTVDLINQAESMRHPLDIVGPIECYADNSTFVLPDIVPIHSYLTYNHSDAAYNSINPVISGIYRSTTGNSLMIRAWNPFENNVTFAITTNFPSTSNLNNVLGDFSEISIGKRLKNNLATSENNRVDMEIKHRSFNTVCAQINDSLDICAPQFVSYNVQGSFLGVGGNSIYVTTRGTDVDKVSIAYFKDNGNNQIDNDLIGKQEGAPFHSWIYDFNYYQSSSDWMIVTSDDPVHSEIINGINHTKWRINIPWGYKLAVEMPGSIIPESDGALQLKGVRYSIFVHDFSGNIVSMGNTAYLAGVNEYVLFFGILPVIIIGLIIFVWMRKKRSRRQSEGSTEELENLEEPQKMSEAKVFNARWWKITKKVVWFGAEIALVGVAIYYISRPLVEKYYVQIAQESTEDMMIVPIIKELLGPSFSSPQFVSPAMFVAYLAFFMVAMLIHSFIFGKKNTESLCIMLRLY